MLYVWVSGGYVRSTCDMSHTTDGGLSLTGYMSFTDREATSWRVKCAK